MPQRLLRPAIRQSKRWNRSTLLEQSLYVRLLTLVDDYARYDADAELLASECFPYGQPDGTSMPMLTVDRALLSLASKDMLVLYEHDGKRYLQLTRWQERVRSESKWPDPKKCKMLTNDSNCCQMNASPPSPSPSPSPSPREGAGRFAPPSLEEMKLHGAKIGLSEAEVLKCHAHYESNGWRVGRNPMKSWPMVMVKWKLNAKEYSNGHQNSRSNPAESPRNIGTANEGRAQDYAKLRSQPSVAVQHPSGNSA